MKKISIAFVILSLVCLYLLPSYADTVADGALVDSSVDSSAEFGQNSSSNSSVPDVSGVDESDISDAEKDVTDKPDDKPTYIMAGTIKFKDTVMADATLLLESQDAGIDQKTSKTNANGQFCFEGITDGNYSILVFTGSTLSIPTSRILISVGGSGRQKVVVSGTENSNIAYVPSVSQQHGETASLPESSSIKASSAESSGSDSSDSASDTFESSEVYGPQLIKMISGMPLDVCSDENGYAINTAGNVRMFTLDLNLNDNGASVTDARVVTDINELKGYPGVDSARMLSSLPMIIACVGAGLCAIAAVLIRRKFFS